jgi:hypothetical protein
MDKPYKELEDLYITARDTSKAHAVKDADVNARFDPTLENYRYAALNAEETFLSKLKQITKEQQNDN